MCCSCLCSVSTLRRGVEKSLLTTNETASPALYNLRVKTSYVKALCSTSNVKKTETEGIREITM